MGFKTWILGITWALLLIMLLMVLGGCTTTSTIINQLAKEGEFESIQVITRRGDRVKVKYRASDWFTEEVE